MIEKLKLLLDQGREYAEPLIDPSKAFACMTLTVLKPSFAKQKPRILIHHNYKFFNNTLFRDQVLNRLRNSNLQISDKDLKHFKETCLSVASCQFSVSYQCPTKSI